MKKTKLKKLVERIVEEKLKETSDLDSQSRFEQKHFAIDHDKDEKDYKFPLPQPTSQPVYDGRAGA